MCVCFQVGAARIAAAASAGGRSVESIGRQLGAGTNCGSCIPEISAAWSASDPAGEPVLTPWLQRPASRAMVSDPESLTP